MRQVTNEDLAALLGSHEAPCISLYQPTHRHHPDNEQDPIRYRNLRRGVEASLSRQYGARKVRALMDPYRALEQDAAFWNHRTEGLAILSSPDSFRVLDLQRPVHELVVVARNFYTKPILRNLQSGDRYQILCLSRHEASLYEGNRDALDRVELTDVPETMTAALGEEVTSPRVAVRTAPGGTTVYFGTGQKRDEVDLDRERFFRAVDRAVLEHHTRPTGLPLLLAALPEHHAPFRALSRNRFLVADGIELNPDAIAVDELCAMAWRVIEPLYLRRLADLVDRFAAARAKQLASDDVSDLGLAALAGRIEVLLVEADRQIPGRIDATTGKVVPGDFGHPDIGDMLNDVAEAALRTKAEVVVVPAEHMPTSTGLAAIYRF